MCYCAIFMALDHFIVGSRKLTWGILIKEKGGEKIYVWVDDIEVREREMKLGQPLYMKVCINI